MFFSSVGPRFSAENFPEDPLRGKREGLRLSPPFELEFILPLEPLEGREIPLGEL